MSYNFLTLISIVYLYIRYINICMSNIHAGVQTSRSPNKYTSLLWKQVFDIYLRYSRIEKPFQNMWIFRWHKF